jgi:hypothetical protein
MPQDIRNAHDHDDEAEEQPPPFPAQGRLRGL